jgi:twitching motility protein PilJ
MVPPVDRSELVSVPLLGRRTIVSTSGSCSSCWPSRWSCWGRWPVFALNQADRVAQQVAGTGQSLMQSQRLAKSVSQALVGSPGLPRREGERGRAGQDVRGLRPVTTSCACDPWRRAAGRRDKITPLMERAEKNAGTVMGQQKILTQVGNALRTINRQSSDLLEIAETVSSLKLQQNAPPAEISAAGQLVMLTQRIGKSSNEFLTMEGVSPEAVFLLGKDLNSFKEIAQGLLDGSPSCAWRAPRTSRPASAGGADQAVRADPHQASAILGNLQGLVSAREAQAAIIATASRCAARWKTCRASCRRKPVWAPVH